MAFVGRDILPLKEGSDAVRNQTALSTPLFAALLALPPLLWAGVRLAMSRMKPEKGPGRIMAEKAEKAMREAASLFPSEDGFWGCLYRGLVSAVLSRAGAEGASLTSAEVSEILIRQGEGEAEALAAARLLERIESARYAGAAVEREAADALFEETRRMIRKLIP